MAHDRAGEDAGMRIPKFKSEEREAEWWYRNRRRVEAELLKVKGSLRVEEIVGRERETKPVTLRRGVGDIERAKAAAGRRGIGIRRCCGCWIHEGLGEAAKPW